MFLLGNGHQSGHTLFRNLYLNLTSTSGMQAGFWCGGGLPWAAPGAAAVFENVHVRAPNPGVEYFGWLFYAPCDASAVIRGCCVNASGAEWIYAIFGDNPPPIVVESCTFVNFPTKASIRARPSACAPRTRTARLLLRRPWRCRASCSTPLSQTRGRWRASRTQVVSPRR